MRVSTFDSRRICGWGLESRGCPHKGDETYSLETLASFRGFLARKLAQSVVFCFGVAALFVVEGCTYGDVISGGSLCDRDIQTHPCGLDGTFRMT